MIRSQITPTITLMNPTPPINTSPKSLYLMEDTSPLCNNPLPHPTTELERIKIFKTNFRKPSTLLKFWE